MSTDNWHECVNMNVMSMRNTYSPKLRFFALSWFMPMDQNGPLQCTEVDPRGVTGWRSPPDPTDKHTTDKGQEMALQALGIMFALNMHKCHRAG